MTTIYLSSTYEDLKDYRRVVFDALHKAGYQVIAMEGYVAADQRPVEKCLKDVEQAHIYVGLFAFRYGYIPPPQHGNPSGLSITELEFRRAAALKKPSLTFLAKDDAGIPLKYVDAYTGEGVEGKRIKALRQHLLTEKLASSFSTPHELSTLVLAALAKYPVGAMAIPDPKPEPVSLVTPLDMVKVPKGLFLYGAERGRKVIDHDYWIDKYPVTNEWYGKFVLADGYENMAYWSPEGWEWKIKSDIICPQYWNDTKWNNDNHPIVGVSYYEAEAFAKWAGKRLPTEREWEKAARGERGRQYPWGEEFDQARCNSSESGIGHTTSVSQYSNGISPYGCYDMAGNVWQWCANWFDEQKKDSRVIRGGSWGYEWEFLRVSYRLGVNMGDRNSNIGFRLAQDLP